MAKKSRTKKSHASQDIANAAEIGGNAMSAIEPFGAAIGATMGAVEEGIALLRKKKATRGRPVAKAHKKQTD